MANGVDRINASGTTCHSGQVSDRSQLAAMNPSTTLSGAHHNNQMDVRAARSPSLASLDRLVVSVMGHLPSTTLSVTVYADLEADQRSKTLLSPPAREGPTASAF
jgi:hypothetical protein